MSAFFTEFSKTRKSSSNISERLVYMIYPSYDDSLEGKRSIKLGIKTLLLERQKIYLVHNLVL